MAIDIYSVAVLNTLLQEVRDPPNFFLDTFFPDAVPATADEIYFDEVVKQRRLAPFVSPLREGRIVDMQGYQTHSFRPAYVKDKRVFLGTERLRRRPGEALMATLAPAPRQEEAVQAAMTDQVEMLARTEEWMGVSALRLGQITVSGEGYDTTVVNFNRPANQTVVLTGATRWGQPGVSPWSGIQAWGAIQQANGGGYPDTVVMDPKSWTLFSADPEVQRLQTQQAYTMAPTLQPVPMSGYSDQAEQQVSDKGQLGDFRFYTYQAQYQDENGVTQSMLPDYSVVMARRGWLQGKRCYGIVRDDDVNFTSPRYFVKSWKQPDPAVRFILLQSAPLVVPYRPRASFGATVN